MNRVILKDQVLQACRRAINLQDQNPASKSRGCFDRRFWAWKLIDYPEATFQRLVLPLSWYAQEEKDVSLKQKANQAIVWGLEFALSKQHHDGSFDQAYPNEHSYGATAFLLHPMLKAYDAIRTSLPAQDRERIEQKILRSADYLVSHHEKHGFIANHLAGSALSLLEVGLRFNVDRYVQQAQLIVEEIVSMQSPEGWYLEYEGADPGYQTLCTHYLAQIYRLKPDSLLLDSLRKSVDFLCYFAHPDGTFGGEYGSRRTAIYYPGGIALLADDIPAAARLHGFMMNAIENGQTVGVNDIDIGNLAPLLSSTILSLEAEQVKEKNFPLLPCQENYIECDFPQAGIHIRGSENYYLVLGVSNGGICKVFDKKTNRLVYNDCGLVIGLKSGETLTTQHTNRNNPATIKKASITFSAPIDGFHIMEQTPGRFLLLRMAALTFMRIPAINELIKKWMVNVLIRPSGGKRMKRETNYIFSKNSISIEEKISGRDVKRIDSLSCLSAFTAIHMASANYPLSSSGESTEEEILFKRQGDRLYWNEEIKIPLEKKS